MEMQHETLIGRLAYKSTKPEKQNQIRGGEQLIITKHTDGSRTMQTLSEIAEDTPKVLRQCIQTVNSDYRVTDCLLKVRMDDKQVGHGWYRCGDGYVECESWTEAEGRQSIRMEFDGWVDVLGTHPIQGDAWHLARYPIEQGPGRMVLDKIAMSSRHHRGCDAVGLFRSSIPIHFLGEEEITVGAGTFKAWHFKYTDNEDADTMVEEHGTGKHPPYHAWVSTDGNYIMLKASVGGYMQTYYELVELEQKGFTRP